MRNVDGLTVQEDKRHLIPLRQQTSNLALIFHNGEPEPTLLRFCRQIADLLPIAWINDSPLEPPLRGFPPQQPNLPHAIILPDGSIVSLDWRQL